MSRRRTLAALAGVLIGGLCFAPVFGLQHLWLPVTAVCVAAFAVTEICRRWTRLAPWRPALIAVAGAGTVIESVLQATTRNGLPTWSSVQALSSGIHAWRLTLESTWPTRPDPELLVFVPLLALIACLLAVELLDRAPPLIGLLPAVAVVCISQLYVAAEGLTAVLVATGLGLIVVALLVPDTFEYRGVVPWLATLAVTAVAIAGGLVATTIDPAGRTPYSLQKVQSATAPGGRQANPLDELGSRWSPSARDKVVFRYQASGPVDRWRLVALDDFDGVNWTTDHPLLRMGAELTPGPEIRVPTTAHRASVRLENLEGPWLPGQLLPRTVSNVPDPQVEPIGSTLLAPRQPDYYGLTWVEPAVDAEYLLSAGIDADVARRIGDLGPVPPEIADLDPLRGRRATFSTAIALEKYFRDHYTLAVGDKLPTGHSWPQLKDFLVGRSPGSSEQFAAGYVALARQNGIPARLVVGFRAPATPDEDGWYTVRNRDAFAWPEVAVAGAGWWPLDPAQNAATGASKAGGQVDSITDEARQAVPPIDRIKDPEVVPPPSGESEDAASEGFQFPLAQVFAVSTAALLAWLIGVPLVKSVRAIRRRRRPGSASVVGAWYEARDRLRAHGIQVTSGMTVRDLAHAARELPDTAPGLAVVAKAVDQALWSGGPATPDISQQAWTGVQAVRRALRRRPWLDRLQAALEVRTLL